MADEEAPTLQFRRNGVDNVFQTAHQHITKIDSVRYKLPRDPCRALSNPHHLHHICNFLFQNLDQCKDTIIETAAAFQALPGMNDQVSSPPPVIRIFARHHIRVQCNQPMLERRPRSLRMPWSSW